MRRANIMEFSKTYNPEETENKIYNFWEKSGFFNPDKLPGKRKNSYCIVIPPPNITGELHMGHALNTATQDIIIRWKRMKNFKTLWLPGTDHAGIATQNVVEKQLKKEGKTRFDLGREEFIKLAWKWQKKYGNIIPEQLKKIGASLDWSRTRFTLDAKYTNAVQAAFSHYFKKGLIYRGEKVINWCPRCQTSLSDLELEYKEKKSYLWFIRYPLNKDKNKKAGIKRKNAKNKNYIVVATTRPETMLGDTAIAINPKDKKYTKLIGKKVILPLVHKKIPIVADPLVETQFGTGAVKVTPAHDLIDYEIGQRHNLESVQIINEKGEITENAPIPYRGLKIAEAREKIIEDLQKIGLLDKTEDYCHQIPKCYRCETTVELIPSKQWFLKMDDLKKNALEAAKTEKVNFVPQKWEKIYLNWMENLKDWCLSRQIWWGIRLPVWHCGEEKIHNAPKKANHGCGQIIISSKKPKHCPSCHKTKIIQSSDTLDTWFSSALWPFATLGWPQKTKDLQTFYPTQLLSTARDIINLWVARMIFSGIEFTGKRPFENVFIHPTVLTKEGKRMSKSLGTGIDPIGLIGKYGADATRFGIAYQLMGGQDLRFSEDNIIMGKKFCNKVWNACRFVMLIIGTEHKKQNNPLKPKGKALTKADKKILKLLDKTIRSVDQNLENFQFGKAAHSLYDFFWHSFCDYYIEEAKKQLEKNQPKQEIQTKKVLIYVLLTSLKLLHPFAPFVTEEIYQQLPIKKEACLMVEKWPK